MPDPNLLTIGVQVQPDNSVIVVAKLDDEPTGIYTANEDVVAAVTAVLEEYDFEYEPPIEASDPFPRERITSPGDPDFVRVLGQLQAAGTEVTLAYIDGAGNYSERNGRIVHVPDDRRSLIGFIQDKGYGEEFRSFSPAFVQWIEWD
jgi:hypothetical protein